LGGPIWLMNSASAHIRLAAGLIVILLRLISHRRIVLRRF
jgi:hypothetical protein